MSKLQAGNQSTQAVVQNGTIVFSGHTYGEIRQIAIDAARAEVLPAARQIAAELIEERVGAVTDMVLHRMLEKDPELLRRFEDPRFLAPLITAQRSYAETGDDELGSLLSGLLTSLAQEPIRTRREIVLREAIDCAPKLTSQHLSALSVIVLLQGFSFPIARNITHLLDLVNEFFEPYYDSIPHTAFEYQYMGATPVGSYLPFGVIDPYKTLHDSHPQAMYDHILEADLKDSFDMSQNSVAEELKRVLAKLPAEHPDDVLQFKIAPNEAVRILNPKSGASGELNETEQKLRKLILSKSAKSTELRTTAHTTHPALAEFLDTLDRSQAVEFQLSPVGMMLARHEIVSRTPELAGGLDSFFND